MGTFLPDSPTADLPTVRSLDALWQKVSAQPLWAPPNFWRYVKLRWGFRLRQLSPQRVKQLAPPGKVNDCASCRDICCVGPTATVLLRLPDIATLLDLKRQDLMTLEKPRFDEAQLGARPALRRHVGSDSWRVFPVLRQTTMGVCAALSPAGHCSLYPHWPLSCARFPYALHTDEPEVFFSPRCDSFWIRADAKPQAQRMMRLAVKSYNQRIRDAILLAYAPDELDRLGLLAHVSPRR